MSCPCRDRPRQEGPHTLHPPMLPGHSALSDSGSWPGGSRTETSPLCLLQASSCHGAHSPASSPSHRRLPPHLPPHWGQARSHLPSPRGSVSQQILTEHLRVGGRCWAGLRGGGAAENQAAGFLTAPPSRCSEGKTGIKHGKAPLITSLPLADALASRFLNTPRVRGTAGTAGPRLRKRIPALPRPAPEPQSYAFAHLLEVYQEPTINYIFSCLLLGKTPVLLSPEQRAHSIESPRGGRI